MIIFAITGGYLSMEQLNSPSIDPVYDLIISTPFLIGGIILSNLLINLMIPGNEGGFVKKIFTYSLVVRLILMLVLNYTGLYFQIAPDENTFYYNGYYISLAWKGAAAYPPVTSKETEILYYYFNAVLFYLFGFVKVLPKIINCLAGSFLGILAYQTSSLIFNKKISRLFFLFVSFFPSLVLWSIVNIREVWIFLALLGICKQIILLNRKITINRILILFFLLILLVNLRESTFLVTIISIIMSFIISPRAHEIRNLIIGISFCIIIILVFQHFGYAQRHMTFNPLHDMEIIRSGLAFGDAKYDSDVDISTPKGALKYLPAGVMYFLFSPLPWQMTKLIHFLTIPELFIWYYVLFLAIDGAIVIFKHRYTDSFFPIILILNLTITFALVEANFGTAYRHRSQTIVFFLMIAAFNYYQRKKN